MKYKSEYAEGQIIVVFRENLNQEIGQEFAITFGSGLGYDFISEYPGGPGYHAIYKTKPGLEKKACRDFIGERRFVGTAYRRDLKLEKRWKDLEKVIEKLRDLRDNCELPDDDYRNKLKKIKKLF